MKLLRGRLPVWLGMMFARLTSQSSTVLSEARLLSKVWQANDSASASYVAKPYPGTITDFRPVKQYRLFDRPGAKWERLAEAGQEVVVLPVYPAGMLVEPFVEHLAIALRRSMDAAIQRCESK